MAKLYSYCIPHDNGAAPNPFWGVCTLVICKPQIRRVAMVGDWIVGTGSRWSHVGDTRGAMVFAMRVGRKVSMPEYDRIAQEQYPGKVPDPTHPDRRRHVGDAIYDFATDLPRIRPGVHTETDRANDLAGSFALLSDRFLYFGSAPVSLPVDLRGLVKHGRGHRSTANGSMLPRFLAWLEGLGFEWDRIVDVPHGWMNKPKLVSLSIRH